MKIIFLDRDGVINKNRSDYVKSWSEFEFVPRSLDALNLLTINKYRIILVTNQSAVNRGLLAEAELKRINSLMMAAVAAHGGRIEAIYYCPHAPDDGCGCRKPKPGLIYQARDDYGFDLSATCMVGDSLKDVQCGRKAGCGKVILVRTGHGAEAEAQCQEAGLDVDLVADDLMDAATWLLRNPL